VSAAARALAAACLLLATGPAAAKGRPLAPGELVDLNAASVEELMRLPGVGRKRAEAIVALRSRRPLRRADDVAQVKGISPAWVAKNRANLAAGAAAAAPVPSGRTPAKP
jgi:competence protein ComEA